MADTREYWSAQELFPIAGDIANIIGKDPRTQAVAVTGSLGRALDGQKEPDGQEIKVHDIDIVVLNDGNVPLGTIKLPTITGPNYYTGYRIFSPENIFGEKIARALETARETVPVDLVLVNVRALRDCVYLQSLNDKEFFDDFYRRIFCDPNLPMFLLWAPINWRDKFSELARYGKTVKIQHNCVNPKCQPSRPWEEAQREVLVRKAQGIRGVSG